MFCGHNIRYDCSWVHSTHTHTYGVGPVQIRCRTNLVESDQEKKWDVGLLGGLIIYTTSLISQCLALLLGTVKLSGAILAVEFTILFPFLFTFYYQHSSGGLDCSEALWIGRSMSRHHTKTNFIHSCLIRTWCWILDVS